MKPFYGEDDPSDSIFNLQELFNEKQNLLDRFKTYISSGHINL